MITDNPIRLIHELKGAPLSIVMLLQCAQQRVTQEWLERCSGFTDKPVSRALDYLAEIGMVDHTRSGWQLTRGAVQLPLMAVELEAGEDDHPAMDDDPAGGKDENSDDGPAGEGEPQSPVTEESRNISDSNSSTSTYLLNNIINHDDIKVSKYNTRKSRKKSDSAAPAAPAEGERDVEAVKTRLKSAGVNLSRRVMDILRRPYMTEDYVTFQIERLEGEGKSFPADAGLLVHVMDRGDAGRPEEARQAPSHKKNCACEECSGKRKNRYSDWEQ